MDRGSDTHGPMRDAALKKDAEDVVHGTGSSRAEDWRNPEPSGEDQPLTSLDPDGSADAGMPSGIDAKDAAARSQFARSVTGLHYPASGAEVKAAVDRDAIPEEIRNQLDQLPADERYASLAEVWADLGHGIEDRRG